MEGGRAPFRDTPRGFFLRCTHFRGLARRFPIVYTRHVRVHVRAKSCSHCNPLRNVICSVQLHHKEPSHASCIYYSRSRAVDRRARIRNRASSPFLFSRLYFSLPFFLFCIFYSALNISRAKRARDPRRTSRTKTRAAISTGRQDLLAQYLPSPSRDHSRNCSPSSVIRQNFLTTWPLRGSLDRASFSLLTLLNLNNSNKRYRDLRLICSPLFSKI